MYILCFVEKGKAANIPLQEGRHSRVFCFNAKNRDARQRKSIQRSPGPVFRGVFFSFSSALSCGLTVTFIGSSKFVPQVGYVSSLLLGNRNMLYSHISVLVSFFSQESANLPHKLQNNAELAPRKSFTERGGSRATRASLCSHQTRYGLKVECTGNGP